MKTPEPMREKTDKCKHLLQQLLAIVLFLLVSCGTETGNPGETPEEETDTLARFQEVAKLETSSHVSEAVAALGDLGSSSSVSLQGFFLNEAPATHQTTPALALNSNSRFSCDASSGSPVVQERWERNSQRLITRGRQSALHVKTTGSVQNTHTFTKRDGTTLTCGAGGRSPVIRRSDYAQLSVNSTVNTNSSIIASNREGQVVRSVSNQRKGTRQIEFFVKLPGELPAGEASNVAFIVGRKLSSDISQEHVKTKQTTERNGTTAATEELKLSSQLTIDATTPLTIEVRRTALGALISKTITSGTVRSLTREGTVIITTVKDLVFDSPQRCEPSSGTFTGKLFASSTDSEPKLSFTIDVTSEGAFVSFDGSTFEPLDLDFCGG